MAQSLGGTAHLSPLLRKTRRLGLRTPGDLLQVAVRRGCRHYVPPDYDAAAARDRDPTLDRLSNAELAVALVSGAQTYDPQLTRCAAQLMGSADISARELARLAVMERCVAVVRHIADAALRYDREGEAFWREVLAALPMSPRAKPGVLPHPTRFVSLPGFTRGAAEEGRARWLRPGPLAPDGTNRNER